MKDRTIKYYLLLGIFIVLGMTGNFNRPEINANIPTRPFIYLDQLEIVQCRLTTKPYSPFYKDENIYYKVVK